MLKKQNITHPKAAKLATLDVIRNSLTYVVVVMNAIYGKTTPVSSDVRQRN